MSPRLPARLRPLAVLAACTLWAAVPAPAPFATFVVNSALNDPDGDLNDAVCDTGTGASPTGICTLRAAIDQANFSAGTDNIHFSIGGGSPTITAFGFFVTDPVVIDATTEPGWIQGGAPVIELTGAGVSGSGFDVSGDGVTIRGFAITNFTNYGIRLSSSNNNVQGNYIGLDRNGVTDVGNGASGIYIDGTGGLATDNLIGHASVIGWWNYVSGNGDDGIRIMGSGATDNTIVGNRIGLNGTGDAPVGNDDHGININDAARNQIGSGLGSNSCASGCNAIGGNGRDGIIVQAGAAENTILNNYIGLGPDLVSVGNVDDGVSFVNAGPRNILGGIPALFEGPNVIGRNGDAGVFSTAPGTTELRGNTIFANGGLGIEFGFAGPTPNDPGDVDGIQNHPTVSTAQGDAIIGDLSTVASRAVTIWLHSNDVCDPSGYGEGETLLGSVAGTADGSGDLPFSFEVVDPIAPGAEITARVSGADGSSEFSACVTYQPAAPPGPLIVNTIEDGNDGNCDGTHCTLREAILAANARLGLDPVDFDIPGTGPFVIQPMQALPTVTDPLTLDGSSQPGYAGVPLVEVDGTNAGDVDGLVVEAASTIDALAVTNFARSGVVLQGGASGSVVKRSYFGLGAGTSLSLTGLRAPSLAGVGNGRHGLRSSVDAQIGTDVSDHDPTEGNVFFDNDSEGVLIDGLSVDATMLGNLLGSNGELGIDVGDDGVTANDADDTDGATNYPDLVAAYKGSTTIEGTYHGLASTELRLELFASGACDASGNGEAEQWLGTTMVTTDASGDATFSATFTDDVPTGTAVTATATTPSGATSEVSACATVADFTVAAAPDSVAFTGQSQGTLEITVAADGGVFNGEVDLSCPDAPAAVACSFSDPTVVPGSGQVTSTLTVSSAAGAPFGAGLAWLGYGLGGLLLLGMALGSGSAAGRLGRVSLVTVALLALGSCGGGDDPPTGIDPDQPVTHTFNVTGTSGGVERSATLRVTVE